MVPATPRGFVWVTPEILIRRFVPEAPFVKSSFRERLRQAPILGRSGRGDTRLLQMGGMELAVRAYRHGGLAGGLLGRRFIPAGRAVKEVEVSESARDLGVATPEVIGIFFEEAGFRSPVLLTRRVPGVPLPAFVRSEGTRSLIRPLASAVQTLFRAGLHHRDLNLGNFLVERGDPPKVEVLDLDGARILHPLPLEIKRRMLARLCRSYRKLGTLGLLDNRRGDLLRFLSAISMLDPTLRPVVRSLPAVFPLHRLFWRRPSPGSDR